MTHWEQNYSLDFSLIVSLSRFFISPLICNTQFLAHHHIIFIYHHILFIYHHILFVFISMFYWVGTVEIKLTSAYNIIKKYTDMIQAARYYEATLSNLVKLLKWHQYLYFVKCCNKYFKELWMKKEHDYLG